MIDGVSVICTVKNGENTIETTIKSILAQTYQNYEVIIVDDGSADNTVAILSKLEKENKQIKKIVTSGIGRSKALNKAIYYSRFSYIANIDADDLWHPKKLEIQVNFFNKCEDLFLLSTNSLIIYDYALPKWEKIELTKVGVNSVGSELLIKNVISHPSVIFNKNIVIELGGYNEKINSLVDYDLWLRAHENNKKMGVINAKLVAKRIHQGQSYENKKRIIYIIKSAKLQLKFIMKEKKIYLILIPIIKLILGFLPFRIRNQINKYL